MKLLFCKYQTIIMKLLIVEDEPNLLAILRKGLSESNQEVYHWMVKLLLKWFLIIYLIVILDVMLPDVNGIEICSRVWADKILFYFF
jgi:DNA-binding response OmpR family regulator